MSIVVSKLRIVKLGDINPRFGVLRVPQRVESDVLTVAHVLREIIDYIAYYVTDYIIVLHHRLHHRRLRPFV